MEVDEAIYKLGLVGRWQFTYYTLIILTFLFPGCWHIFNIIWIGYKPPHHCKLPVNSSVDEWIPRDKYGKLSSCSMYSNVSIGNDTIKCVDGWEYNESFSGPTIATKWDLVCDRGYLVETSQTIMACGVLLGSLIFTRISDHFGRKPIIITIQICLNIVGFATVFCERIEWYYVLRFFEGTFQQGVISCNVVQMCEMFSTEHRALIAIIGSALWGFAACVLPLFAYLVQNWVHFQIIISLYGFLFIPVYWWLPETIPWLHANNRVTEAEDVLLRAAKMNKIQMTRPILKPYHDDDDHDNDDEKGECLKTVEEHLPANVNPECVPEIPKEQKETIMKGKSKLLNIFKRNKTHKEHIKIQYSAMLLVKNRRLFTFLIICIIFGMVDNLVYYGLVLSSNSLSDNHYLNGFLNAVIEIPGCIVTYLAVQRFGRKRPMAVSHALAGVALLCCVLAETLLEKQNQTIIVPALSITGKFWISGAFAIDIFYVTEIFPTNLRNQAFGFCIFFSRLGNLMASYASYVVEHYPSVLPLVFGILSILVAVLIIFLPETRGRPLPETIEDIESWYESDKKKNKKEISTDNKDCLLMNGNSAEGILKV